MAGDRRRCTCYVSVTPSTHRLMSYKISARVSLIPHYRTSPRPIAAVNCGQTQAERACVRASIMDFDGCVLNALRDSLDIHATG